MNGKLKFIFVPTPSTLLKPRHFLFSLLAGITLTFWCPTGNAQIIYSNSFSGEPVTIDGTAPTVANNFGGGTSNALWIFTYTNALDGGWLADGAIGANAGSALLPFKPQSGAIYFLTASITLPASMPNWIGLGFSETAIQGSEQTAERFTDANVKGGPWMDIEVANPVNFFGGPEGSLASAATEVEPAAGTYTLTIILNTSGTNWTTSAYVNGVIEGTNVVGGTQLGTNIVYTNNPAIGYVGLTQQANTGGGVQWNYLSLSAVPVPVPATYTAVINPNSVLVTNFQGWGVSLCWWANVIGGYPNRSNYVDMAFSQLALNIVRYNIGGGENPTNNFLSYRATMQGFEPANGVWNWNADLNQRWVLQAALARGANLVDAFANSPPWWMTVSGSVTGAVGSTNNLQVADETLFATYLATVVSNLTVLDGVHFNYVTPMNEPVGTKWTYGGTQEGCDMSATQQIPVINDLRAALNISLPSAGIDTSEDVDPYQSVSSIDTYPSATLSDFALCSTHTYTETGNTSFATEANNIGKPMWVTEYGDSDGTGLTMAKRIHDDITVMGVRAWCYWQVVDSASGWGFLYNPLVAPTNASYTTNYTINQKFYVMGQFSEFIRPGYKIISVNDSNTLAAWNPTNSTLVLVTVNTNTTSFNVAYNLGDFPSAPWQIAATQTASGESNETLLSPVVTNGQFTSVIPAGSVTTFVLATNATTPIILNQSPAASTNGITVYAGQTPTFSVSAIGAAPLYYEWFFNGEPVAVTTNASLTPTADEFIDVTNVSCIVSNSVGTVSNAVWSITVVAQPTAAYPRAVLALNPIAYWRLNETPDNGTGNDGVICHDYAGGNNGVYSNVVLAQPGYSQLVEPNETSTQFGYVLTNNSNAGQIAGPDFTTPAGSNAEFSVAAWANGTGYKQNLNAGIVTKGYFYGEELDLDEGAPGDCFRFEVRSAAGTSYNANSSINAYTNSGWHHLVGVCDEANSNLSFYVDGALAGSVTIPAQSGITNSPSVPISIGARASSATSGNNQQFFGWINDVAIFNYALNSNQVQTLYQAGTSLPAVSLTISNPAGNQLQFNWNYGTLQTATNVSGPYTDLPTATQPWTIAGTNASQFYRIREN